MQKALRQPPLRERLRVISPSAGKQLPESPEDTVPLGKTDRCRHRIDRPAHAVELACENTAALYELSTYTLRAGKLGEAAALYESEGWPALQKYADKLAGYFTATSAP